MVSGDVHRNPFASKEALESSCYTGVKESGDLFFPKNPEISPSLKVKHVHTQFAALISVHPCAGSRNVFANRTYRYGLYEDLGGIEAAHAVCYDLFEFLRERKEWGTLFTAYIASFEGPHPTSEMHFDELLWKQVQLMTDLDRRYFDQDPDYSSDPRDHNFVVSIGGVGFFIAGFNPASKRFSRRFAYPTLVFTPQHQFDDARETGLFEKLSRPIQQKEVELNGEVNPNIGKPYAAQMSGWNKLPNWTCPYHRE